MYTYVYENQENPEVFHPNLSLQRWKKKIDLNFNDTIWSLLGEVVHNYF